MGEPLSATPVHPTADPRGLVDLVDVVLEGGPTSLPAERRRHRAASTDTVVKVAHCGGYEHFERDGSEVFRWIQRTHMAE